jgi:hypothetical protein
MKDPSQPHMSGTVKEKNIKADEQKKLTFELKPNHTITTTCNLYK